MVVSLSISEDLLCCLALHLTPGMGHVTCKRLLETFESPSAVCNASDLELMKVGRVRSELVRSLRNTVKDPRIPKEVDRVKAFRAGLIGMHENNYPALLREIHDPPILLYTQGDLMPQDEYSVAVVGTRTPTRYGLEVTRRLCAGLAEYGVTVVSGLARGIDGKAHRACLDSGGRTIAVLGSGLDVVYPREHETLCREVSKRGAVVSEFPMGTGPKGAHFPKRNRIISGLSLGTVVVEAAERSGSLITAQMALDQNREVFAVPGSTGSMFSRGTNRLIKQGAKLVETADDIIEELRRPGPRKPSQQSFSWKDEKADQEANIFLSNLPPEERLVYDVMASDPIHVDEIVRLSGLAAGAVAAHLLSLELKSLVEQVSGNTYSRKR